MNIIKKSTPNYTDGRDGKTPNKIIIHWIGAGDENSTIAWFANADSKVSAHYLIADDRVYQFVDESDTAWHAGNWNVNTESIGIEHEATPTLPVTESTYQTSGALVKEIAERWGIPLDRDHIKGHNEIKATQCPGTLDLDKIIRIAEGDNPLVECEEERDRLDKELDEMRESRNKWRTMYQDLEEKYEKECAEKGEHIKSLQSTVAEQSNTISALNNTVKESETEKKRLRKALSASEEKIVDMTANYEAEILARDEEIATLDKKATKLKMKVDDLKNKLELGLAGYTKWELFKQLFRRR